MVFLDPLGLEKYFETFEMRDFLRHSRQMKYFLLLSLFIVPTSALAIKFADPVRVGIPAGLAPPLVFDEDPAKLRGIVPEYVQALAEILDVKVRQEILTRYRLEPFLLKGEMDILCYTSQSWSSQKGALQYSRPLFTKYEVLLGKAPLPKEPKDLQDLKGQRIGTILQYVYPLLKPLFDGQILIREDGPTEESNLKKLKAGRISYIVTDEIFVDYFKIKNPDFENGQERLRLQKYPVECAIGPKSKISLKDLNSAIEELQKNGKLRSIFKKYGVQYTP